VLSVPTGPEEFKYKALETISFTVSGSPVTYASPLFVPVRSDEGQDFLYMVGCFIFRHPSK
jgi:hypothetical protein